MKGGFSHNLIGIIFYVFILPLYGENCKVNSIKNATFLLQKSAKISPFFCSGTIAPNNSQNLHVFTPHMKKISVLE
jgi:hypothetical protein